MVPSNKDTGIYLHNVLVANWAMHTFEKFGPIFKSGAVLAGASGTGKSTLIDAIMTVITGSIDKSNYNMAASSSKNAKRSFLNYVRGTKEGSDNRGRTDYDFSTHIAIEFIDAMTGRHLVFGGVTDYDHTKPNQSLVFRRYSYEGDLVEDRYIVNGEAASVQDLKAVLEEVERIGEISNLTFYDSKRRYCDAMMARFRLSDETYIETNKSLLALTKSSNIKDFVFESLCGVSGVISTDRMDDAMVAWQAILDDSQAARDKLNDIEQEIARYDEWVEAERNRRVSERALAVAKLTLKRRDVARLEKESNAANGSAQSAQSENDALLVQVSAARSALESLRETLAQDDAAQARKQIEDKITLLSKLADSCQEDIGAAFAEIMQTRFILDSDDSAMGIPLVDTDEYKSYVKSLASVDDEGQCAFSTMPQEVRRLVADGDRLIDSIDNAIRDQQMVEAEAAGAKRKAEQELSQIAKGGNAIDRRSQELIEWIERTAGVRPVILADAIDIKDGEEDWSLAVEGVLGNRRFDLVVPEADRKRAWEAYKTFPGRARGSLIESGRIKSFMSTRPLDPDSLAARVVPANDAVGDIAYDYIRYHLGRVKCVFDMDAHVNALPETPAVTPDGSYYRGFARTFLNRETIRKSMIGAKAREAALEARRSDAEQALASANLTIKESKRAETNLRDLKRLILSSESAFGKQLDAVFKKQVDLDVSNAQIESLSEERDAIDTSTSDEMLKRYRRSKDQLVVLEGVLTKNTESLGRIKESADKAMSAYEKACAELDEMKSGDSPLLDQAEEGLAIEKGEAIRCLEMGEASIRSDISKSDSCWNTLVQHREACRYLIESADIDAEDPCNSEWEAEAERLRDVLLPALDDDAERLSNAVSQSFLNEVAGEIASTISLAKSAVRGANRILSGKEFTGKRYEFKVSATEDVAYHRFYKMVTDKDFTGTQEGLWSDAFHDRYADEIDDFKQVIRDSKLGESESIRKDAETRKKGLLDVKNYLDFEMIQIDLNGTRTKLSSGISSSSGGEWALPLYLVLGSGLAKTYRTDTFGPSSNTLRLAMIDEAFSGIDDASAEEAFDFFEACGLQPIAATPEAEKTYRLSLKCETQIHHYIDEDGFGFDVSYDKAPLNDEAGDE